MIDFVKKKVNSKNGYKLEFEISSSLSFGIKYYLLCKESKEPLPIKVNALNNKNVKTKTDYIDEVKETKVEAKDMLHYIEFGGLKERAYLNKNEIELIKSVSPKGIKLLGFKPREYYND